MKARDAEMIISDTLAMMMKPFVISPRNPLKKKNGETYFSYESPQVRSMVSMETDTCIASYLIKGEYGEYPIMSYPNPARPYP